MRFLTTSLRHSIKPVLPAMDAGQLWLDKAFFAGGQTEVEQLTTFPSPNPLPAGWMNDFDLSVLYNVALRVADPFLEIGPWIGRSTSAICAGIRDSSDPSKIFDVIDFGICGIEEYKARFGYLPDFDYPDHVRGQLGSSITAPGGTVAVLIENLRLNGLLSFTTTICRGDWIGCPHGRKYGFAFIDAVHDRKEAERHVPKLRHALRPGAVVIVDDVVERDFALMVCDLLGSKEVALTRDVGESNKLLITRL